MCQIVVDIPNEVMFDTHMNTKEATAMAKRMLALGLYTQRSVSLGYCAKVADMTEEEFIRFLGKYKISIFQFDDEAELLRDIANAGRCTLQEQAEAFGGELNLSEELDWGEPCGAEVW